MNKLKRLAAMAAVPIAIGTGAAGLLASGSAHAATTTVSATTALHARPDSGYGGNTWANDSLSRQAVVTLNGADFTLTDCGAAAASCYNYSATISDAGTAYAITGATSPGSQAVPIKGTPSAAVKGNATVTFHASSSSPDATLVPTSLTGSGDAMQSTTNWVEQFFPSGTTFGSGPVLTNWSWTYDDTANCQTWVDALNGTKATSGDITGVNMCPPPAAVPVLSGGKAVFVTNNRENVTWTQSLASWDKLVINGPGFAGQVGWVDGHAGSGNLGAYTGLHFKHGYGVTITPYTAKNGSPVAGAKSGTIYFVS
jgi:hypothetical protein